MPLFRDENPALGPSTVVKELSGFGAGNPVVNYFKPTTREPLSISIPAAVAAAGLVWVAPWKFQVLAVKLLYTTASSAAVTLDVARITQAAQPLALGTAPNGTTVIDQLSAGIALNGAANTVFVGSLSTASGSPLIGNAGDILVFNPSGAATALAGAQLQVEIAQIG